MQGALVAHFRYCGGAGRATWYGLTLKTTDPCNWLRVAFCVLLGSLFLQFAKESMRVGWHLGLQFLFEHLAEPLLEYGAAKRSELIDRYQ